MPKKSKDSTESASVAASVPAVPVAAAAAAEPVAAAKKPRKSKEVAAAVAPAEPAPAPATSAAAAPAETVAVSESAAEPVEEVGVLCARLYDRMSQMRSELLTMMSEFKSLSKRRDREMKVLQKLSAKKKRKSSSVEGGRPVSGITKPTKISDELAAFLGKERGSEMSRTEVTRELNVYITAHNLKKPENKRFIQCDAKLAALLNLNGDDVLTFFNLQKYMKHHFAKAEKKVAAPAAAAH